MKTWIALAGLGLGAVAQAEQGVFVLGARAGPRLVDAPQVSARGVALHLGLEYGLSERWGVGSTASVVAEPQGLTIGLGSALRLTIAEGDWVGLHLVAGPEFAIRPASTSATTDLAVRAGLVGRWLLLWGLGLWGEIGGRWNTGAWSTPPARWEAFATAGIYIEA